MSGASDLYFQQVPVGQMANFAYLIGSYATREAVLVDPAWNVDGLLDRAEADDMNVVGALVTHYHQDHVGGEIFGMQIEGIARLLARHPVPIHVNEHEADGLAKITGASLSDLKRRELPGRSSMRTTRHGAPLAALAFRPTTRFSSCASIR